MLPLFNDKDKIIKKFTTALDSFSDIYKEEWSNNFRNKIGLFKKVNEDINLINELLHIMEVCEADFTQTFRLLSHLGNKKNINEKDFINLFNNQDIIQTWLLKWRKRLISENTEESLRKKKMLLINPKYIPRNHLVDKAIRKIIKGDMSEYKRLLSLVTNPYEENLNMNKYSLPPKANEEVFKTYCGT